MRKRRKKTNKQIWNKNETAKIGVQISKSLFDENRTKYACDVYACTLSFLFILNSMWKLINSSEKLKFTFFFHEKNTTTMWKQFWIFCCCWKMCFMLKSNHNNFERSILFPRVFFSLFDLIWFNAHFFCVLCIVVVTVAQIREMIFFTCIYLATARNAKSTFSPVFADVSINVTLYSRANRSPSSRLTSRSGQSALLPDPIPNSEWHRSVTTNKQNTHTNLLSFFFYFWHLKLLMIEVRFKWNLIAWKSKKMRNNFEIIYFN